MITRRKAPRRRSKGTEAVMKIYWAKAKQFLAEHPQCAVFYDRPSRDVHHQRGRAATLLLDDRFWIPISRDGHLWVDAHPLEARKRGLLCAAGEWNRPPRDERTEEIRQLMRDAKK